MKRKMKKILAMMLATISVVTLAASGFSMEASAASNSTDPVIIVSLGDSYSSGEGIEPFYGQEKTLSDKVTDQNWLAHRSTKSWAALLTFPGTSKTTGEYFVDVTGAGDGNATSSSAYQWYFVAASGAETINIRTIKQAKSYSKEWLDGITLIPHLTTGTVILPRQLDVFDDIPSGTVDYVTLTIGGNDVDFADIITACCTGSSYLDFNWFSETYDERIAAVKENIENTKENISRVYRNIQAAAGEQAAIIVAGYPKLLDKDGKGALFSKDEATTVNEGVTWFNNVIESLVSECAEAGMNIYYVDIEAKFDEDGGHQAYSSDSWINKVMLAMQDEDLEDTGVGSSYSMHPNEKGAEAYAECVNAKIQEIEDSKGTLSGKVCKASDRVSPISNANIEVYKDDSDTVYMKTTANSSGNFSLNLPAGDYRIEISASGYISFVAYATVSESGTTYLETFLMVAGSENDEGIATGTISNAVTGAGIEGVSLSIREGWNNTSHGDVVATATTDSSGNYSVTLPLGNYTIYATKSGYISTSINIIVQDGTTSSQNGSMSPIDSEDSYRIVLTWGENPSDLDSHVVGELSDGSTFHTYYADMSAYDGDIEVCSLDVDDVTSYGPETITLYPTTSSPYYYYIYRFAGTGTVATSEAQIKVYKGDSLLATFNVPTDQGDEDYWNVFAIVDGQLVVRNTITDSPDTTYASPIVIFSESDVVTADAGTSKT